MNPTREVGFADRREGWGSVSPSASESPSIGTASTGSATRLSPQTYAAGGGPNKKNRANGFFMTRHRTPNAPGLAPLFRGERDWKEER